MNLKSKQLSFDKHSGNSHHEAKASQVIVGVAVTVNADYLLSRFEHYVSIGSFLLVLALDEGQLASFVVFEGDGL